MDKAIFIENLVEAMHQDFREAIKSYGIYGRNFQKLLALNETNFTALEIQEIKKEAFIRAIKPPTPLSTEMLTAENIRFWLRQLAFEAIRELELEKRRRDFRVTLERMRRMRRR